jgi:hypothetical protein
VAELTPVAIQAEPFLKELLTVSRLVVFRDMDFLLDFIGTVSECALIAVFAVALLKVTADFGFILLAEVIFASSDV